MSQQGFSTRYGPWALITGAAMGLGAAYAEQIAAAGVSVVLVDRAADPLAERAAVIERDHGVDVASIVCDLSDGASVDALVTECEQREISLLVANAAAVTIGPFAGRTLESLRAEVDVNVVATMRLVHAAVGPMRRRGHGGIIVMSSQSSRRGAPLVAHYAATKAYLATLAEGLWEELGPDGIDVLAVLPGNVSTPSWLATDPRPGMATASVSTPADVVSEALEALGRTPSIVPGLETREAEAFMGSLDRAEAVRLVGTATREMYPHYSEV